MIKNRVPHYDLAALRSLIGRKGGRLCALLYANSQPRVATALPLARAIADAGHLPIVVFDSKRIGRGDEDISGYEDLDIGMISHPVLQQLEGVDVIFSSEVVADTPRGSRSVRIVHSLPDRKLVINYATRIRARPHLATTADYLAIAVRQSAPRWSVENYTALIDQPTVLPEEGRRDRLDIVPAGYPKIDYLAAEIPRHGEKKYLMYCPTSTKVSQSRVVAHGAGILHALLENFPRYEVVFRPYPSADVERLASLKAEFGSHPRFRFDDTLTGISFLRKTAMVITDFSSAAVSFSLATGRPSVFFSGEGQENGVTQDLVGFRVSTIPQILNAVKSGLKKEKAWFSKIMRDRDGHLYNAGSASRYLAGKLPVFAAGGSDPDWLSVPRERLFTGASSAAQ